MKRLASRLFGNLVRPLVDELQLQLGTTLQPGEAVAQKLLMQQYRMLAASGREHLPSLDDVGFRVYSQFEEDGILLYLFSLIPPVNRRCVEICAGDGRQCMTTNLIVNHGWWGYLFDGNEKNVRNGERFFANQQDTFLHPPLFAHAWITAESVDEQLSAAGATGVVDLLSLDMDGMDYWVWKAVTVIQPRVVVCETNNLIPAGRALTVPYSRDFVWAGDGYCGASLEAMCRLGKSKGYRLVGMHRFGFNAFFMANGVGEDLFPEVDPNTCLSDPYTEKRRRSWAAVASKPWQDVG